MVHNKRLSVPKLVMSVHAGLISFPAFNKYVAEVIRHNFSAGRDLVHECTRARARLVAHPHTSRGTNERARDEENTWVRCAYV